MKHSRTLRLKVEMLAIDEADQRDAAYWKSLTGAERLQKLVELRMLWIPIHEQRLKRTFRTVKVA
jgi:hypothetical protein